jgi:hypothetical protein
MTVINMRRIIDTELITATRTFVVLLFQHLINIGWGQTIHLFEMAFATYDSSKFRVIRYPRLTVIPEPVFVTQVVVAVDFLHAGFTTRLQTVSTTPLTIKLTNRLDLFAPAAMLLTKSRVDFVVELATALPAMFVTAILAPRTQAIFSGSVRAKTLNRLDLLTPTALLLANSRINIVIL